MQSRAVGKDGTVGGAVADWQRIAIYDMDKTITRAPTWTRFLVHYARHHAPHRLALLPVVTALAGGYPLRLIDRARLKELSHWLMIGAHAQPVRLASAAKSFARRERLFADARARIAADRADGYRIVVATASHSFYAGEIARLVGADAVIATEAMRDADGNILHRLAGENCYGAAKLARIEAWLATQQIERSSAHIRFYSDHVSDAPALGWADEGFVVNADPVLRSLAAARGWTALDWR